MKVIAGPSGLRRITTLRLVATRTAVIPDADDFGGVERRRKATSVPRLQCFENRAIVDLHPEFQSLNSRQRFGLGKPISALEPVTPTVWANIQYLSS
ncbi:hypothetical protein KIN20_014228 [Parelaphostrongylus tenuis]|uniref:Uncharacterized protein n=1 Tax=Parelaphostrongylus tenuis TaxID=148309 RepID=A0AAD5MEM4_PARTN|nr:hypothetical protein KIN20_014228 [Parelaphostrongylus tenuis]